MPSIQQGWSTASDTDRWVARRRMPIASRGPEARGGRVDEEAAEPSGLRAAGGGRSNSNDGFLHVGRLVASTSDADRWATCPQRRIPIAGLRDVGYRTPRVYRVLCCVASVVDRLLWLCRHVGEVDLDLDRLCFCFDFFPLGLFDRGCRSLLFSSLAPSDASLISEHSELAPLDTSAA